jgi:hypothetical protein
MSWRRSSARTHTRKNVRKFSFQYVQESVSSSKIKLHFNADFVSRHLPLLPLPWKCTSPVLGDWSICFAYTYTVRVAPILPGSATNQPHTMQIRNRRHSSPQLNITYVFYCKTKIHHDNFATSYYASTKTHLVRSSVWSPLPTDDTQVVSWSCDRSCRANSLGSHTATTDKQSKANYTCDCHCLC